MCLDPKLQKLSKFCIVLLEKIIFLAVTLKVNILGHMLLNELYTNVTIAKILPYPFVDIHCTSELIHSDVNFQSSLSCS